MLILTIETSTPAERVAVVRDGKVLAELTDTVGRGHTEKLLGAVESALERSGAELGSIEAIAVSIGPGRFSGLRVGLATAKGLAAPSGIPVVPVPTLETLAASAGLRERLVCPMLDARKGEVYAALFRSDGDSQDRLMPDVAVPPSGIVQRVAELAAGETVTAIGSGAVEYRNELAAADLFELPEDAPTEPTPVAMAAAVEAASAAGTIPTPDEVPTLEPVYLRGI